MALFQDDNGSIIEHEDNFDPNTGENLSINDFVSKVKAKGGNVKPINLFQDTKGTQVAVPVGQEKKFIDLGLKPIQQIEAEQSAQQAHKKVLSGDIGYQPNKSESFLGSAVNSATANITPQVEGLLSHTPIGLGNNSQESREIAQSLQANRERENPISSALGSAVGTGVTAAATGGVSSIPKMVAAGAGLGGVSELESQINKEQPLSTEKIAQQGGLGGTEALVGAGIGKGIQKLGEIAGKAGKGLIPQNVRDNFLEGLQGKELASPEVNREVQKSGAIYAKHYNDALRDIKSEIGSTKGDLLHEIGMTNIEKPADILGINGQKVGESTANTVGRVPVGQDTIRELIENEQKNLINAYDRTALSHEKESLNNAYNLLQESMDTIELNPPDAHTMDLIKQKLGDIQFDDVKPIKKSRDALKAIHNVREGIMNYLESQSEKLGGTNKSYKNLIDAEEADKLHSIQFSPSEVMSLGSDTPSAEAMNKLDNAEQFYSKIKNNPALSPEIKNRMGRLLDDMVTVAKRANVAKAAAKGGVANVANQAGYLLSKTPKPLQSFAKTVYGIPESIYNNLPIIIQRSIAMYPDLANKFKSQDNQ
jgi:hypothetical protein